MISLLNSKVIDVDRLDYLIRDAFFTGFDIITIDYERILDGHKVIENVVYAHDAERKLIQNHPIVLYNIYIIQHII